MFARFLKFILGLPVGAVIALLFHHAIIVNVGVPEVSRNFIGALFALFICLGFSLSAQVRCVTLLMLPSVFGTQGRAFVEAFALTLILAGRCMGGGVADRETVFGRRSCSKVGVGTCPSREMIWEKDRADR